MPYLPDVTPVAAAAGTYITFQKPVGGKVLIKSISLYTDEDLKFGRWICYLEKIGITVERHAMAPAQWIPQAKATPTVIFEGSREWPQGWKLMIFGRTQTASEIIRSTVEYEHDVPPRKSWWSGT